MQVGWIVAQTTRTVRVATAPAANRDAETSVFEQPT
jgi:hypothetical protein